MFVVLAQPDGDWDHLATLYGVYSTIEKAAKRVEKASEAHIIEVEVDQDLDPSKYA